MLLPGQLSCKSWNFIGLEPGQKSDNEILCFHWSKAEGKKVIMKRSDFIGQKLGGQKSDNIQIVMAAMFV